MSPSVARFPLATSSRYLSLGVSKKCGQKAIIQVFPNRMSTNELVGERWAG
jgi:hypothetical protein